MNLSKKVGKRHVRRRERGICRYRQEADELRTRYMQLLSSVFEKTGVLWERYDENGAAKDLEYPTQMMLGWTAGVYRYFASAEKNL